MAEKVLMKGNEALAEAAMRAGCKCFFGYPITPQTEISAYLAKKMAKALENCNSPFEENVIKSMKHFAFSMIPWGIIYGYFFNSLILTVLIVLIVMAIVYIFSYGAELQHESDDTV